METEKRVVYFNTKKRLPIIKVDLTTELPTKKRNNRLGIHVYYDESSNHVKPIVEKNGDIVLFFLGRPFYGDSKHIIKLYTLYGMQYVLKKLQGVFTFILLDQSYQNDHSVMYIVSDPFGTIPIYYQEMEDGTLQFSTTKSAAITTTGRTQIRVPTASYCKLVYTNKVSSVWSFDPEDSIPSYHRETRQWVYPKRRFRYFKYRNILEGVNPFSLVPYSSEKSPMQDIIKAVERSIANAMEYRLMNFTQRPIYCIGNPEDPEFQYMKQALFNIDIPKNDIFVIHVESIRDSKCLEYLAEVLGRDNTKTPITIFTSSGFVLAESEAPRNPDQTVLDYDAAMYIILEQLVPTRIIPEIIEPLQQLGVLVEFPFLEEKWLTYYFSILPQIRQNFPLKKILEDLTTAF